MNLPVLDAVLCTGCADCVALCPTDCLAMAGALPWLPRPLDCVSCALCELVCPVSAIQVGSNDAATAASLARASG